jgi:hypothetical protein
MIGTKNNKFNCVAYTLDVDDWLWPNEKCWPHKQIPRNLGLVGFKMLYKLYDYIECSDDSYEEGYDKIAFYSKGKESQHACRQFGNMWRSKLGEAIIIEHKLEWLCGDTDDAYGDIAFIMKRKK